MVYGYQPDALPQDRIRLEPGMDEETLNKGGWGK